MKQLSSKIGEQNEPSSVDVYGAFELNNELIKSNLGGAYMPANSTVHERKRVIVYRTTSYGDILF